MHLFIKKPFSVILIVKISQLLLVGMGNWRPKRARVMSDWPYHWARTGTNIFFTLFVFDLSCPIASLTDLPIINIRLEPLLEEYEKKCRKFRANPIDTGFYVCKSEKNC